MSALLEDSDPQSQSDYLLLEDRHPQIELVYHGSGGSMMAFTMSDRKTKQYLGQARFYDARKTLLIRMDLPEGFTACPDRFRGEDEDTGRPFSAPAWNTADEFVECLKKWPIKVTA